MKVMVLAHGGAEEIGFNLEMMLIGGAVAAMALKLRSDQEGKRPVLWAMLLIGVALVIASLFVH